MEQEVPLASTSGDIMVVRPGENSSDGLIHGAAQWMVHATGESMPVARIGAEVSDHLNQEVSSIEPPRW